MNQSEVKISRLKDKVMAIGKVRIKGKNKNVEKEHIANLVQNEKTNPSNYRNR